MRFVAFYHEGCKVHSDVRGETLQSCAGTEQVCPTLRTDLRRAGLFDDTLVIWAVARCEVRIEPPRRGTRVLEHDDVAARHASSVAPLPRWNPRPARRHDPDRPRYLRRQVDGSPLASLTTSVSPTPATAYAASMSR
ncbi:MAG: DUF1501 domain-containing protein [Planctomycetes bacterium]|nr:DUF1501 domain-containing protein [Planctomycetota bacterium]